VHESAGHAPFIIDVDYAEFLQRFGVLGRRAISNKQDMDIYDAIRNLSIVKESSSSGTQDVERAEQKLKAAIDGNTVLSEASLLSRLHWWTVEYGLVGEVDDYRIFGAGLLSSVGESVSCLNDEKVQKRLLTVDAIDSDYDITNEQELLYVTKSCRHLGHVLHEFARNMCCNVGGAESVRKAIEAQTVNTVETNSGVEISGQVEELICDAIGNPTYLRVAGPVQLAFDGSQLDGHGIEYHAQGFGSPIGRLERMERCLSSYSMDELAVHDIRLNEYTELAFLSGIKVRGKLTNILRKRGKNILMSFIDCTVTDLRGELLFSPDWGTYDMAVGDEVVSVYGGSADQLHYPIYPTPSARVKSDAAIDTSTQELMVYYQRVRDYRTQSNVAVDQIESLINEVLQNAPNEWLLLFELAELHDQHQYHASVYQELINSLKTIGKDGDQQTQQLVRYAMQRLI
jgi:phenylalanine-4-hydroxylase